MAPIRFALCPVYCVCVAIVLVMPTSVQSEPGDDSSRVWEQLVSEAARLYLPTQFLKNMPPDFVRFEFDDLHTYAAEYHPGEHRLVLNRTLSFNAAGGTLKPLTKMTHKELDLLYHELFHAHMDFLSIRGGAQADQFAESPQSLLSFARSQQACRYGEVAITPIVQRKNETEMRYLTESESWEALNETWAVFIGWAIWNQLEVQQNGAGSMLLQPRKADRWLDRFEQGVRKGELRGYYVPEAPDERRLTHKRFLAKQSQLSGQEALVLMKQVLGFTDKFINQAKYRAGLSSYFKAEESCAAAAPE